MNWGINSMDKKSLYSDHVIRRRDDFEDSTRDACKTFKEGGPHLGKFSSPNYPNNYAKNITCFRLLEGRKLLLILCFFQQYMF